MTRHYLRGDPATRALARVIAGQGGCWIWTGALTPGGYSHMNVGGGRYRSAHVVLFEHFAGSIPEGHELDHLCRNHRCVNPRHLEAVTHLENVRRGEAALHALTGRCGRNHDLAVHGYSRRDGRGMNCRQCRREKRAAGEWR